MSTPTGPADPDDRSATAGEYVLGTLDRAAHRAVGEALATDRALQAEVYAWQDRLLGLARRAPAVDPPADLWARIDGRLRDPGAPVAAAPPTAANDPLWRRLRRWQLTAGVALAASVVLASALVLRMGSGSAAPDRYLAVLQAPDKSAGWVVEITAGRTLRLVPVGPSAAAPAGKSVQFWTKPQGAAAPTSLGLVRVGAVTELPAARLPALGTEQLFELTLEPDGGSPIGRPTGPILYVGRTVHL